jgi:hypothetical protein
MVFENLAVSHHQAAVSDPQSKSKIRWEIGLDKAVIRLLNATSPFACNKSAYPPGGVLAEERRQRVAKIGK